MDSPGLGSNSAVLGEGRTLTPRSQVSQSWAKVQPHEQARGRLTPSAWDTEVSPPLARGLTGPARKA